MTEWKYMSHSAKSYTGLLTNQAIKDEMGGSVGSRADTVKYYKKSEKKGRKI